MAEQKTKSYPPRDVQDSASDDGELGGYSPAAPGITSPLVVAEGGHEGSRAMYEYRAMGEGRIAKFDTPESKFVDYDSNFQKSDSV